MKSRKLFNSLVPGLLVLCIGIAAGCSLVEPEAPQPGITVPEGDVVLINETIVPMAFVAMELEVSHRFDPNPAFDRETFEDREIHARAARGLTEGDLEGYERGDDLRVFIYRRARDIGSPTNDGYAPLNRIITVDHEQLARDTFRVRIDSLTRRQP